MALMYFSIFLLLQNPGNCMAGERLFYKPQVVDFFEVPSGSRLPDTGAPKKRSPGSAGFASSDWNLTAKGNSKGGKSANQPPAANSCKNPSPLEPQSTQCQKVSPD